MLEPTPCYSIAAWLFGDVLLERYWLNADTTQPLPRHVHNGYQLGLRRTDARTFYYRGAYRQFPPGKLSVIHPGEVHFGNDHEARSQATVVYTMYVPPSLFQQVKAELTDKPRCLPFFPEPVLKDASLPAAFLQLHKTLGSSTPRLEQEERLQLLLAQIIGRHDVTPSASRHVAPSAQTIGSIRDYLHAHYAEEVSLRTLAKIAGLHQVYLCRFFQQIVGLPPHAYQIQLRLAHARQLLAQGVPLAEVATTSGFAHQSHFGNYFKRTLGVTPGQYAISKVRTW